MSNLRPTGPMRSLMLWWLILSVIITPILTIFVGPLLPPGAASDAAHGQQQDNTVMLAVVAPIIIALLLYFGYVLTAFRARSEAEALEDGPPLKGDNSVVWAWMAVTFVIVLFLATWGAYELFPGEAGAGGGEGPNPIAVAKPADASTALPVQVIGQQWSWTFRYPGYGGVETTDLVVPANRTIRFSVTSIDVVHSFWAIDLGVKADAVPGTSNVAYAKPVHLGLTPVRCAELCGLWHGHMTTNVRVVTPAQFAAWISRQRSKWAPVAKYLPKYGPHYAPEPTYRAG